MADAPSREDVEDRHRRGLTFRKRDDHAIELFREAQANLTDITRVNRILLELGRFYNPTANGPIIDLATRRKIVELLEASKLDEARGVLDERLARYARIEGEES